MIYNWRSPFFEIDYIFELSIESHDNFISNDLYIVEILYVTDNSVNYII